MIENGIYVHFKGEKYEVLGMTKHSETLEPMVSYRHLGETDEWSRPEAMWNELTAVGIPRFQKVKES